MKKLTERQKFERWAEYNGWSGLLDRAGLLYVNTRVADMWAAWQASARVRRGKGGRK